MVDFAADLFRALITGAIFLYLRAMRGQEPPRLRKAWIFFLIGFGLLFLGGLLGIAESVPFLRRFLRVDRSGYADFFEQVIGYILGLLFLGIGFWRWIPAIIALRAEQAALRKSEAELKQRIVELTAERNKLKKIIECELRYAERDEQPGLTEGKESG